MSPVFSLYAPFWVGDHTAYKHDPEKNATGITLSFGKIFDIFFIIIYYI